MSRVMPVLVALIFASLAWPVVAQTGVGRITDKVAAMDRNFDAADTNHDGVLSKDEAKAGHVPFIVRNFDRIDTRHRGQVSKDDVHEFIRASLMRGQSAPVSSGK